MCMCGSVNAPYQPKSLKTELSSCSAAADPQETKTKKEKKKDLKIRLDFLMSMFSLVNQ